MKFKLEIELGGKEMRTSLHLSRVLYDILEKITADNLVVKAKELPVRNEIQDFYRKPVGFWELSEQPNGTTEPICPDCTDADNL